MTKTERQLKILMFLQSKNKWTVNAMAKHFGISRRTVFRDLRDIQELNVPMEYDPEGGHKLMEGYKVPPLMFTRKELSVIGIALSFMQTQSNEGMAKDATEVELKINSALGDDEMKAYLKKIQHAVIVDPYLRESGPKTDNTQWFDLADAIASSNVVKFNYEKSEKRDRILSPYIIAFFRDHWNLIGYDHDRQAIRSFILKFITDVELSPFTPFLPHEEKNALNLVYSSENTENVKMKVKTDRLEQVLSNLPARAKIKKSKTDWTNIEFDFNNADYLANWSLQFGTDVLIKSPNSYVTAAKCLIKEMKKLYK